MLQWYISQPTGWSEDFFPTSNVFWGKFKTAGENSGRVLWSTPQPASPRSTSSSNLLARSRKAEQEKKKKKKKKYYCVLVEESIEHKEVIRRKTHESCSPNCQARHTWPYGGRKEIGTVGGWFAPEERQKRWAWPDIAISWPCTAKDTLQHAQSWTTTSHSW